MSIIENTELRHLQPSKIVKIAEILDTNESWQTLLIKIPKYLNDIEKIRFDGQIEKKYESQHIRLTKEASKKKNVSHTEALLDEWSTSGRIRPTIKHFYDLLINVPLYRAADYIADELLDISLPIRPSDGPAKQIDIKIPAAKIKDNLSDCLKLGIQNVKNAKPTELEDAGPSFIPKLPNFDRLGKSESDCIEEANECMERNEIKRNNPTLTEWKHEIQNVKIAKPFESFAYKVPDFDRLGTSESQ